MLYSQRVSQPVQKKKPFTFEAYSASQWPALVLAAVLVKTLLITKNKFTRSAQETPSDNSDTPAFISRIFCTSC